MARKYFLRPSCVHSERAVPVPGRTPKNPENPGNPEIVENAPSRAGRGVGAGQGALGGSSGPSRVVSGPNSARFQPGCDPKSAPGTVCPDAAVRPNPGLVNCAINERYSSSDWFRFLSQTAPVVGFEVLKNDVVAVRAARNPEELAERLEGSERGKIEFLSSRSRRRLALVAGNCDVAFKSFVTLTYPARFPCDGVVVKRHLHAALAAIRRKCPGVEYLWFLEFQKRGAPHFHMFLDAELPGPLSPMARKSGRVRKTVSVFWPWQDWLSERWFEIVGSGDPSHLKAGAAWEMVEKVDGCARYVAKEAYKTFQKTVPEAFQNVGRFWGCSRGVRVAAGKFVSCTPQRMAEIFGPECFGAEGDPFPVMFGAAESYRKVLGTPDDPAKLRGWKSRVIHQAVMPLMSEKVSMDGKQRSQKFSESSNKLRRTRKGSRAQEEWHGSTL